MGHNKMRLLFKRSRIVKEMQGIILVARNLVGIVLVLWIDFNFSSFNCYKINLNAYFLNFLIKTFEFWYGFEENVLFTLFGFCKIPKYL